MKHSDKVELALRSRVRRRNAQEAASHIPPSIKYGLRKYPTKSFTLRSHWRHNQYIRRAGTIDDFLKWLGVKNVEEAQSLDFAQIENLPNIRKLGIRSLGGSRYLGDTVRFKWDVRKQSKYLRQGEVFWGTERNYSDAALKGLLVMFEMMTLRKRQSRPTHAGSRQRDDSPARCGAAARDND